MKRKQKITKLTNLIILDASGSMATKADEVRGGLKQLLSQIKTDAQRDVETVRTATIVTDFSSHGDFNTILSTTNSAEVEPNEANGYTTRGMTALYDAISKSFSLVSTGQDSVFVTIFTDGQENDSKEMTHDAIKALIKDKKARNWVITFMGTTEADINNAKSLGISAGNTMMFANTGEGVMDSMMTLTSARSAHYSASVGDKSVDLDNLMNTTNKQ